MDSELTRKEPEVATLNQNSQEALCEEILADARRQSEQVICRAQQEAGALIAKAAADAEKARHERLDLARAEATRRKELILARVPVETGRLRAVRIEGLLQAIYAEARRRLAARYDFDYRRTLVVLAAEAISRMSGGAFVVKLSVADYAALGDGLAQEIALRAGRSSLSITISEEPTITESGLIVQDGEGRQVWDNRLAARLERLWPELRRQIAVQSSLVTEAVAAGASRFTHHALVAPKSPVAPDERGGGDEDGSRISASSPILTASSERGAQ